jgi:hypothetical protein
VSGRCTLPDVMSNARRPRTEAESSPAIIDHDQELQAPIDPLTTYRDSLVSLKTAVEKAAALHEVEQRLLAESSRTQLDRERCLSEAAQADEPDVELLSRLSAKGEVYTRKLSDIGGRIRDAEAELSSLLSAACSQFAVLWRSFLQWSIEAEKSRLLEQMIPGCDTLSLERVALFGKAVVGARALEVVGSDAPSVTAAATRLLEALPANFAPPPYPTPVADGAPPAKPRLYGPYLFKGMTQLEIEAELLRIRKADASLDLAASYQKLAEVHPELFLTEAQVLAQNQSLIQPQTGIWKAPMIGDTKPVEEPAEAEEFSHV